MNDHRLRRVDSDTRMVSPHFEYRYSASHGAPDHIRVDDRGPAGHSARSAQEREQNNMNDARDSWVRRSDAQEERERLFEALKGWWKVAHPFRAYRLYRQLRATSEAGRRTANERLLEMRLADPALASLNEDQRRAVIVQEDRTLIVAGAGTGKTHTMVAKARDSVRTGIARPEEIAFVTFTRKAAQEIRDRSGDLPGMEIGTIHHLARVVIMRVEGKKPRLTPLVEDEARRLTQLEEWLLEAVQEDPTLLADLETRRQAIVRCRTPQGEMPPGVRVPPDKVLVCSMGEARIATTLHLADVPYRYEAEFPVPEEHRSKEGKRYFPDFYLPDQPESWGKEHGPTGAHKGVWLEHFATDANGKLPERWDEDEVGSTAEYRRTRVWKETLHRTLGTRFAWTEYGDIQTVQPGRDIVPRAVAPTHRRAGKERIQAAIAVGRSLGHRADEGRRRQRQAHARDLRDRRLDPHATPAGPKRKDPHGRHDRTRHRGGKQRALEARPPGARTLRCATSCRPTPPITKAPSSKPGGICATAR